MYPPLTGYKEKENPEHKMSIDSIGPSQASQFVKPAERAKKPHQQVEEASNNDVKKQQVSDKEAGNMNEGAVNGFYAANSMNTQDFLLLKEQGTDDQFAVLDEVITKMKENIEELGDAMEVMSDLAEKTSKANLGLQIIEKTLEAMDEAKGEE